MHNRTTRNIQRKRNMRRNEVRREMEKQYRVQLQNGTPQAEGK